MITYALLAAAVACLAAAVVYVRSARLRLRVVNLIDDDVDRDVEAHSLAFSAYRKEAHSAIVYGLLAPALAVVPLRQHRSRRRLLGARGAGPRLALVGSTVGA